MCRELGLALEHFPITAKELKDLLVYGFKRSFYPGPYEEKRRYVRSVINFYEELQRRHLPETAAAGEA